MRITNVSIDVIEFSSRVGRDDDGMVSVGVPGVGRAAVVRIATDEGIEGLYVEDDVMVVDQLSQDARLVPDIIAPVLIGSDPYERERLWILLTRLQRMHLTRLHDRIIAVIDVALWDLVGKATGQPIHRLLGTYRSEVPAYASTMMGQLTGPLSTPEGFADFALQCHERGFAGFKLHTWAPMLAGDGDHRLDAEACAAVRNAVGDGMALMLDPWHFYGRHEALWLGQAIQELGFHWYEEPMDEADVDSYRWLCDRLDIPVTGPEIAAGRIQTRLHWISQGACDIVRAGVLDIGGITPMVKMAAVSEAAGVPMSLHLGGVASLHVLAATSVDGWFFERGLLHPDLDIDEPLPWLGRTYENPTAKGVVDVPMDAGLGIDVDEDFLRAHGTTVSTAGIE